MVHVYPPLGRPFGVMALLDAAVCCALLAFTPHGGTQRTVEVPGQHVNTHFQPDGHSLSRVHDGSSRQRTLRLAQNPLPTVVWKQAQLRLFWQVKLFRSGASHLMAQWQLPFSRSAPPFLRHRRRWRRVRASALSAKPMLESAAPSTLYPAHFIACRLEIPFSASPLASSSRSSNTITAPSPRGQDQRINPTLLIKKFKYEGLQGLAQLP